MTIDDIGGISGYGITKESMEVFAIDGAWIQDGRNIVGEFTATSDSGSGDGVMVFRVLGYRRGEWTRIVGAYEFAGSATRFTGIKHAPGYNPHGLWFTVIKSRDGTHEGRLDLNGQGTDEPGLFRAFSAEDNTDGWLLFGSRLVVGVLYIDGVPHFVTGRIVPVVGNVMFRGVIMDDQGGRGRLVMRPT